LTINPERERLRRGERGQGGRKLNRVAGGTVQKWGGGKVRGIGRRGGERGKVREDRVRKRKDRGTGGVKCG